MDSEMRDYLMEEFLFVAGIPVGEDRHAFVAHYHPALREGIQITQVMYLDQLTDWYDGSDHKWGCTGIAPVPGGEDIIVLGRDGEVAVGFSDQMAESNIEDKKQSVGPTRGVRCIGDSIFAYGMRRQVYRRDKRGDWESLNRGIPPAVKDPNTTGDEKIKQTISNSGGFNAVAGPLPNELYAVGTNGEIWRTNDGEWLAVDSPTNILLTGATTVPDGTIYACGLEGMILKGRGEAWSAVTYEGQQGLGFRAIASFKDQLFLADGDSVRRLKDGVLSMVDFGVDGVVPAHYLYADSQQILTLAGKEIYCSRDGETWIPILS